jgi:hypothetical protein
MVGRRRIEIGGLGVSPSLGGGVGGLVVGAEW